MNEQFKNIFGEDFVRNLMESMQSGQGPGGMNGLPGMFGMPGNSPNADSHSSSDPTNRFRTQSPGSGPAAGPSTPMWNPFAQNGGSPSSTAKFPPVTISETRHEIILVFDIPGLDRANDVRISVFSEQVSIKGEIPNRQASLSDVKVHLNERRIGEFERTVHLPKRVKRQHAKAVYQQGLLELRLLKEGRASDEGSVIDVDFA